MNPLILKRLIGASPGQALGPELVTNGDFSSSSGWQTNAGVSIGGGKATTTAASGYLYRLGGIAIVSGKTYRISFSISNYSGGTIKPYILPAAVYGATQSGNGNFTSDVVANASNGSSEHGFNMTGFSGDIDNLSIKEVL